MRSHLLPPLLGGVALLLGVVSPTARAQQELDLFEVLPRSRALEPSGQANLAPEVPPTVVRVRPEALALARPGTRLRLTVGPGVSALAEVTDIHTTLLGRRVVAGGIVGRPSGRVLLVFDPVSGEAAASLALSAEDHYVLGRAPDGAGLEMRHAPTTLMPRGTGGATVSDDAVIPPTPRPPAPRPRALPADPGLADAPTRYDLLIVYTAAARAAAGGTETVELLCELAAENCNRAYANSGLALRARLVHTMESAFVESGSYTADLDQLASGTLVSPGDVAGARDQYGADFVSLFVAGEGVSEDSAVAGKGYLNAGPDPSRAFSICNYQFAADLTLAHEIGHNMGCAHDRANSVGFGNPAFAFSYGWRWTGADGALYRDVMAYAPGTPEPIFSSPLVTFQGVPTGDPAQADNARTLAQNAPAYCNYRQATVGARPLVSLSVAQREALQETGQSARLVVTRASTDLSQPLEVRMAAAALSRSVIGAPQDPEFSPYSVAPRAVAGTDFAPLPPTATIPAGVASVEVTLAPLPVGPTPRRFTLPKVAFVALLTGNSYEVGTPALGTVLVYEQAPGVALSVPQPFATQNPPRPAQVVLSRTETTPGSAAAAEFLNLSLGVEGTAREGVDYTLSPAFALSPTLVPGEDRLTISVSALPGANLPPTGKTLSLYFATPPGQNHHFDPYQRVTVTLLPDAPVTPPAVVSLTASAARVAEGGAALKLYFARAGGDVSVDLTVTYKVSGAGLGRVTALPGTVTIPAGAARAKVKLRAADDGVAEGDQAFKVTVLAAEGYTAGSPAKVKLVVGDPTP